ncbi:MAG: hypothetical protein ABJB47_00205 [Actinomycetota bacterium]
MRRDHLDLDVTGAVAVLACAAVVVGAPVPVTAVFGIALFAAPGYLLSQLLLGSALPALERAIAAAALAFCVPVLGGLLLYAAGIPLHRTAWLGLLAGLTLAGDVALLMRRRVSGPVAAVRRRPGRPVAARHAGAFGAAVLIVIGALAVARVGADKQPSPRFTQLWLVHRDADAPTASLGVGNHEGRTTQYRVVLLRNGRAAARWTFSLANGRSWHKSPGVTGSPAITVNLFRLPDGTTPYRHVSLSGDRTPPT